MSEETKKPGELIEIKAGLLADVQYALGQLRGLGNQHTSYGVEQNMHRAAKMLKPLFENYTKTDAYIALQEAKKEQARAVEAFAKSYPRTLDITEEVYEAEKSEACKDWLDENSIAQGLIDADQALQEEMNEEMISFQPYRFRADKIAEITPDMVGGVTDRDRLVGANTARMRLNWVLTTLDCVIEE